MAIENESSPLSYNRHFALLAGAIALLSMLLLLFPSELDPLLPRSFALYGALHALTIAMAAKSSRSLASSVSFVGAAAGLSAASILAGSMLAGFADSVTYPTLLMLISLTGALFYGGLIKLSRRCRLSWLAVLAISGLCAMSSWFGLYVAGSAPYLQAVLVTTWWLSVSLGLWLSDRGRVSRQHYFLE